MNNVIATCNLSDKNGNVTYFNPHWLYVEYGKKKWRFENEHVSHIEFNHHKLLIPLIIGGLFASFAILGIFRNLFDPFWALLFLLSGVFLTYYGWLGSSVLIVHEGQHTTKIYLQKISNNLKEYFRYYRSYCVNQMNNQIIYHIASKEDWANSINQYSHPSLEKEGFIHASKKEQLIKSYELYFPKQGEFLLLEIDSFKLGSELKYELAPARNEMFPHIYGEINLDCVISAKPFEDLEQLKLLLGN